MDVKQVKALLRMFEDSAIHELEVQSGEDRVRFVRSGLAPAHVAVPAAPAQVVHAAAAAEAAPTAKGGNGHSEDAAGHMVKAPVVGTFYRAPSPGAPPFVDVGSVVQQGQVLCIIEAMKLMNEIEADRAGRVTQVFVENGQPVEYDHPLFLIAPV